MLSASDLQFERDGAEIISGAVSAYDLTIVADAFGHTLGGRPGRRPDQNEAAIGALIAPGGAMGAIARRYATPGETMRPVRVVLFDKTPDMNWAVPWHQDRTIAVEQRAEVQGFNNWNRKGGVDHVEPPIALLSRMVTLRLHLDDTGSDNAALDILPGSHRLGRIEAAQIAEVAARAPSVCCEVARGDVLAMRLTTIHKSERASLPAQRRVLHVDYSADELPLPLRWAR